MTDTLVETVDIIGSDTQSEEAERPDRFLTQSGVMFKLKPVSPMLLADAASKLKKPRMPRVPNFDKDQTGRVMEDNPSDPDYIQELAEYSQRGGDIANGILLVRGSEVISRPAHVQSIESTDWVDEVKEIADLDVPDTGRRRYYLYLKYYILESMDDFFGLIRKISSLGGVTLEVDVAQAMKDFRSDKEPDTNRGVSTEAETEDGDRDIVPNGSSDTRFSS